MNKLLQRLMCDCQVDEDIDVGQLAVHAGGLPRHKGADRCGPPCWRDLSEAVAGPQQLELSSLSTPRDGPNLGVQLRNRRGPHRLSIEISLICFKAWHCPVDCRCS